MGIHFRSFLIAIGQLRRVFYLIIFVIVIGASLFQLFYKSDYDPQFTGDIIDSILATISLMFSMEIFSFPYKGPIIIKLVYTFYPFLGMSILGVGLLEFSIVVFTQRYRISKWNLWMANMMNSHTILVGLGNVGTRVLEELRLQKIPTVVITQKSENQKHSEFLESVLEDPNVSLVFGDATEKSVLNSANVKNARALIAVTDDDLVNFKIATKAKEMNPQLRTVIRAFDQDFARKVTELFDVDAAISTSAIAAPAFVTTSFESGIIQTLKKGDTKLHLTEIKLTKPFKGSITVKDMEDKYGISVIALNKEIIPESEVKIESGVNLLLLGKLESLRKLKTDFCLNYKSSISY